MSSLGHEWAKHEEHEGWSVCSRCGMVRNYDREQTTCSGALPKIRQRTNAKRARGVLRPVIKWAGGKSRLVEELLKCVPKRGVRIFAEPFCGGAAFFFALASLPERKFERAVLADRNRELVALYVALRDDVEGLVRALGEYRYDRELYYRVRDRNPESLSDTERGARLVFLNKTCFNGLWRVNSKGEFNVPFGRYKSPKISDPDALRAASRALEGVSIVHGDFSEVTRTLGEGDFAYFDPPYVPVSKTAAFTTYASGGFSKDDQARLRDELARLRGEGVRAVLSNADTPETRDLYRAFSMRQVLMPRSINSDVNKRGEVSELLVTNWTKTTRTVKKARTKSP